ncbi:MAG: hypothetical protein IJR45_06460, partial [Firmicutes bacterium]|nr:hypothetical protein [Bacillota bacterium]
MKKRIISLLLCLSVVSSVIPSASAFAAAEESASVSEFISAEDAEKMLIEAFENAEFEMPKDMAVYANTYTEYVYIHNIDELRAIDGHDGGYYELAADIDLAGAEWKPLKITNAVFNGKGHWIYNLKQTAERSIGLIEWSYEDQPNTYMMNTNFSDIDINVTNAPSGSVYVAALGGKAGFEADNCYVSGKVNVDVDAKDIEVVGMMRTTNCKGRLDINVKGKGTKCIIWGIASSTGSDLAANITVNSKHPYFFCAGMSSCKNDSNFVGDIKIERVFDTYINDPDAAVVNAQVNAMTGCKDSSFTGDITETLSDQPTSSTENKSLYQTFISSSENCTYTGDVDVKIVNCPVEKTEASLSFTDIGFSTGCVFNGSTTVDSNAGGSLYLHGIKGGMIRRSGETELTTEYCKECAINGDLKAWGYNYMTVVGLDLANNSVMTGNAEAYAKSDDTRAGVSLITECYDSRYSGTPQLRTGAEEFGFMDALSGSTNCTAKADLKTEHGNVTGISVCDNCTLYGDLHTKSGTAQGITGQGSKCFLYGDVTTDDGQASGISYTTGSNISGTITQKLDDDIMYVSSSSPFYGIYECGNCGRKINSFQK